MHTVKRGAMFTMQTGKRRAPCQNALGESSKNSRERGEGHLLASRGGDCRERQGRVGQGKPPQAMAGCEGGRSGQPPAHVGVSKWVFQALKLEGTQESKS